MNRLQLSVVKSFEKSSMKFWKCKFDSGQFFRSKRCNYSKQNQGKSFKQVNLFELFKVYKTCWSLKLMVCITFKNFLNLNVLRTCSVALTTIRQSLLSIRI